MSLQRQVLRAVALPLLLGALPACGDGATLEPVPGTTDPSERLAVEPASASLQVGESLQFRATGPLAAIGAGLYAMSWSSSDPAVIRVSASGMVTAVGPGSAYVTASQTGVFANALVLVSSRR